MIDYTTADVDLIVWTHSMKTIEAEIKVAERQLELCDSDELAIFSEEVQEQVRDYWLDYKAKFELARDIKYGETEKEVDWCVFAQIFGQKLIEEVRELRGNYHWLTQELQKLQQGAKPKATTKPKYRGSIYGSST